MLDLAPQPDEPPVVTNRYIEMLGGIKTSTKVSPERPPIVQKKVSPGLVPGQKLILDALKQGSYTRDELGKVLGCPCENLKRGLSNVVFRGYASRDNKGVYNITPQGRTWQPGVRRRGFEIARPSYNEITPSPNDADAHRVTTSPGKGQRTKGSEK